VDRTTLLKNDWLKELKTTRNNREGIGVYTLDTFDEELASGLADCSKKIMIATLMSIYDLCNDERITSKDDVRAIVSNTINEIEHNSEIEGYEEGKYDVELD
jgi:hypothetical protein